MADFYGAVMSRVDARIDASRISDDLTLPSGATVRGRFEREAVELQGIEGGITAGGMYGTTVLFRCAASVAVRALIEGDLLTADEIVYKLQRRLPHAGDNNGRVVLELGRTA